MTSACPAARALLCAALAASVAGGCVAPAIDRAAERTASLVADARKQAEEAAKAVVDRAGEKTDAALKAALDGLAAERAKTLADAQDRAGRLLADVDARVSLQRAETLRALKEEREAVTASIAALSATWKAEAEGWRAESAKWRETVAPLTEAAKAFKAPAPTPDAPGLPTEDKAALWIALAGAGFTFAKTGFRVWQHKHAAEVAGGKA